MIGLALLYLCGGAAFVTVTLTLAVMALQWVFNAHTPKSLRVLADAFAVATVVLFALGICLMIAGI